MIRALTVVVLALSVSSASAQDTVRVGAVSLAYVARSSKAGKSALAAIEKFVKQKESEAATKAAELEQQRLALQKVSAGLSPRALADLQKVFDKSRLDFDRFQQDTRAELEGMQARFDDEFPGYGFREHKGYSTPQHLEALSKLGPCRIHRKTFSPCRLPEPELFM